MLEKIKLQNFKLHKDTTLEIKPITIDIGTFEDVLRKEGRFIGILLDGNLPTKNRALKEAGVENIQIHYDMKFRNNRLNFHSGEVKGGQYHLEWDWKGGKGKTKNYLL